MNNKTQEFVKGGANLWGISSQNYLYKNNSVPGKSDFIINVLWYIKISHY